MIKYVEPVSRSVATGTTAEVYEGLRLEFGVHAEPITLHSPAPEILAGAWSVCRETLVARGRVDRMVKEAVATAVSSLNRCPFCVDAHAAMLAAGGRYGVARQLEQGEHEAVDGGLRKVVDWALATRSPDSTIVRRPPFKLEDAPELIGTAVLFHYMNRPVSVFCDDTPFPLGGRFKAGTLWMAGRRFRRFTEARPDPGATLALLPEAELPDDMAWAAGSPVLAAAWARFAAAVERSAEGALPTEVRARVLSRLHAWRGEDPGLRSGWVDEALSGLPGEQLPAARLALLTVITPYRVDERVVDAYREDRSDEELVGAVAWAALAAARRVGAWLWQTRRATSERARV